MERVQFKVGWTWAKLFGVPQRIIRMLCCYSELSQQVRFEGCVADPLQIFTVMLPGSEWSVLLLRIEALRGRHEVWFSSGGGAVGDVQAQ